MAGQQPASIGMPLVPAAGAMLQLLVAWYSCWRHATAISGMLQLLVQCCSFWRHATASGSMLQLLVACYSCWQHVTAAGGTPQLVDARVCDVWVCMGEQCVTSTPRMLPPRVPRPRPLQGPGWKPARSWYQSTAGPAPTAPALETA
eukprot:363351-Chlamydomonas_euryale.AAC.2